MAAPNRTFESRLGRNAAGHRRLVEARRPDNTEPRPGTDVIGQSFRDDVRLAPARHHLCFAEGEHTDREFRVGPMLYATNVQHAFDYYREGIRYAAQNCTYEPYPNLATSHIEVIHTCAAIAARGVLGAEIAGNDAIIHLCGNAYAVGLPDNCLYPVEEANAIVLTGIRGAVGLFDQTMRDVVNREMANPPWNTAALAEQTPPEAIPELISIMATHMSTQTRSLMMNCYIGIFLAYTQQGNITVRKLTRVTNDLAALHIVVTITPDQIRNLWNIFGPYFDDSAAKHFFPYWQAAFTGRVLRMQLIMSQVANAGLTALTLIRTALTTYPDFRWDLLAGKCPREWANFMDASRRVGDDIYYGFRKDLGVVGVRHYKAIAYAGKKLHQECMGDQNMLALQTLSNVQIPEAPYIDSLVQNFKEYKRRADERGDRAAVRAWYGAEEPQHFLAAEAPRAAGAADLEALQRLLENFNQARPGEL